MFVSQNNYFFGFLFIYRTVLHFIVISNAHGYKDFQIHITDFSIVQSTFIQS